MSFINFYLRDDTGEEHFLASKEVTVPRAFKIETRVTNPDGSVLFVSTFTIPEDLTKPD